MDVECDVNNQPKEEVAFKKISSILEKLTNDNEKERDVGNEKIQSKECRLFFERLSTFNNFSWGLKPLNVSPPICARYGWKLIKPNVLQCVSCGKVLSSQLPPAWQTDNYNRSVLKLEKSLKEFHYEYCSWPFKYCIENYLYESLLNRRECVKEYEERLKSFVNSRVGFPVLAIDIPDDLKVCCKNLQSLKQSPSESANLLADEAVILALTGWSFQITAMHQSRISCAHCLRCTDPSIYKGSSDRDENDTQETDEPKAKQALRFLPSFFHPINEHHKWCPWINVMPNDDETPNKLCWMVLYKALLTYDRLPQESLRNVVLKVRSILNNLI